MKKILIIGAGKSSTYLINYLLETAVQKNRQIIVADISLNLAQQKINNHPAGKATEFDLNDDQTRKNLIQESDLVISMLPASLHPRVAKDCLTYRKHFFTASYESQELQSWKEEIGQNKLLFLNECGLDPGIDHMSAMKVIDQVKSKGYKIKSFKSFTGGLMAPESDDNPWKYKFTWNPRNVVLAGQGTAKYLDNNEHKFIPYHKLFERNETIHIDGYGNFEGYANRDSLAYQEVYKIHDTPSLLRGTLRKEGFCLAWNVFVQLGMTDDTYSITFEDQKATKRNFLNSFLPFHQDQSVEEKIKHYLPWVDDAIIEKISYLGLFSHEHLDMKKGSPAAILQSILEPKWSLKEDDKDMIVMQHIFEIETPQGIQILKSSLVDTGENQIYTAMAKTVGLPLAIAADLFLDNKIKNHGLLRPTLPELYNPILDELEKFGIVFQEDTLD